MRPSDAAFRVAKEYSVRTTGWTWTPDTLKAFVPEACRLTSGAPRAPARTRRRAAPADPMLVNFPKIDKLSIEPTGTDRRRNHP